MKALSQSFTKRANIHFVGNGIKEMEILIENDISGSYESETSTLGRNVKRFKPNNGSYIWSKWRVGLPVIWKGHPLVIWMRGYHCQKGEQIMWILDTIWNAETNKPLRKVAQENCLNYMRKRARLMGADVSDVNLTRWSRPLRSDGWMVDYKGVKWKVYPSSSYKQIESRYESVDDNPRTYIVEHDSSGNLANWCKTLKEAKTFIKYKGGEWIASRSSNSVNQ